ncbi:hypothetical protein BAUCODRAFT_274868 [Baudoinia panamericana UAMH 10762]|uniref:Uncharacterized protein n=1 Tax=Baudoinia panamericana (strain UAMH 10762) TaxID=717646 RepID=M2N0E4_BAUPA|nr:uncharacterized protein BAUCODRAFT_274868 [Baudoinia panamericana UAMH 10762]EMC92055.1 hypothetical protein BAUCODRAFT_274868 [Baudoinia panamericana UAMH 10762]
MTARRPRAFDTVHDTYCAIIRATESVPMLIDGVRRPTSRSSSCRQPSIFVLDLAILKVYGVELIRTCSHYSRGRKRSRRGASHCRFCLERVLRARRTRCKRVVSAPYHPNARYTPRPTSQTHRLAADRYTSVGACVRVAFWTSATKTGSCKEVGALRHVQRRRRLMNL